MLGFFRRQESAAAAGKAPPGAPGEGWSAVQLGRAAIGLALLAGLVLTIDLPAARWFQTHPVRGDLARLVRLAEVFGWGGSASLIILTAAVLDIRGWRVVPRLAAAAFGAGLAANLLKLFVVRLRPSAADLTQGVFETFVSWGPLLNPAALEAAYGRDQQAFPSGHAATAAGLAIGLAALYPRGRWLFALFAVLACIQRLEAQAHFCSDVLSGAALGCFVGGLLRWQRGIRAQIHPPPPEREASSGVP